MGRESPVCINAAYCQITLAVVQIKNTFAAVTCDISFAITCVGNGIITVQVLLKLTWIVYYYVSIYIYYVTSVLMTNSR